MNSLEKKSFYSFLALYIFSSLLFISLIAYWYYEAQKNALENEIYYKLQHIADLKSGEIIMAHMKKIELPKFSIPDDVEMALIDTNGSVIEGKLIEPYIVNHISSCQTEGHCNKIGYCQVKGYSILISDAPRKHLNIEFVVVQSKEFEKSLYKLKSLIYRVFIIVFISIVFIAILLSKIFMRPIRQRVIQIEQFINDVTHELNTPITSLSMSTKQALKQGKCTLKTLNNISISTKQLYDIYSSLTYLNFSSNKQNSELLDLKKVLKKSIEYYTPLAEIKKIKFITNLEEKSLILDENKATLLFGNLIGNAIKYSSFNSSIIITLTSSYFSIKDEGIGIEKSKQKKIFEKFKRGTDYSGGFGVGLNIVKSICDESSIKIVLNSIIDEGTEIRLVFK